jgi:hypothetical protein
MSWVRELRRGEKVESAQEMRRGGGEREREIELHRRTRMALFCGLNPRMTLFLDGGSTS